MGSGSGYDHQRNLAGGTTPAYYKLSGNRHSGSNSRKLFERAAQYQLYKDCNSAGVLHIKPWIINSDMQKSTADLLVGGALFSWLAGFIVGRRGGFCPFYGWLAWIYNKISFKSLKKFDYFKFCGILTNPYRSFSAENCDRVLSPILAELSWRSLFSGGLEILTVLNYINCRTAVTLATQRKGLTKDGTSEVRNQTDAHQPRAERPQPRP